MRLACPAVLVITASLVGGVTPVAATNPGRNGVIAFEVYDRPSSRIGAVRPRSRARVRLQGLCPSPNTRCMAQTPRWSPDGRALLFHGSSNSAGPLKPTVKTLGGARRTLPDGVIGAWAPDGRTVVLTRSDGIYLVGFDGSGLRRISTVRNATVEDWSSRNQILFRRDGVTGLYTMTPRGTRVVRITRRAARDASFSPDGRRIVYDRLIDTGGTRVSIMRFDGRFNHQIRPRVRGHGPVWSPDGKRIAFIANAEFSSYDQRIFTVRPNGRGKRLAFAFSEAHSNAVKSIFAISWQPRPRR